MASEILLKPLSTMHVRVKTCEIGKSRNAYFPYRILRILKVTFRKSSPESIWSMRSKQKKVTFLTISAKCIKSMFLNLKYFLGIPLIFCILSEKAHLRIFLPLCTFLKGSGVVFPTMAGRILPHPLPPPPPCSPVPSPRWPGHGWPGPGWPGLGWPGLATWLAAGGFDHCAHPHSRMYCCRHRWRCHRRRCHRH